MEETENRGPSPRPEEEVPLNLRPEG